MERGLTFIDIQPLYYSILIESKERGAYFLIILIYDTANNNLLNL